jgi:hypothetical protein
MSVFLKINKLIECIECQYFTTARAQSLSEKMQAAKNSIYPNGVKKF